MNSHLIEAPPAPAPAGTRAVIYACLSSATFRESALHGVHRFMRAQGWVVEGEFVDIGDVLTLGPGNLPRPERAEAMALAERGEVAGIVVPSYVMLFFGQQDRADFFAWQQRTKIWVSSPWNTADITSRLGPDAAHGGRLRPMWDR